MKSKPSLWAVRVIVLGAFAATVWLYGPRAVTVLAAKFESHGELAGPKVQLDRVGFTDRPAWLEGELLLAVAEALSPWLSDELGILDEPGSRQLCRGLESVAWVRSARVERVFPDRFRLHLALRRPLLAVHADGGEPLCLVDEDAVMLPFVAAPVPKVVLYRGGGSPTISVVYGERCGEARVRAAVGVAREWFGEVAPLVADCPELLEVDTINLGGRWAGDHPAYPEVRVFLRRDDGEAVVFGYGRPVDSPLSRVAPAVKASVLGHVLAEHPGLAGLDGGELRFKNRWRAYLKPRPVGAFDPIEPWAELSRPR
ncbi:MAG TPA: hypothetical protein ENI87_04090 [bacterium]|nr:hypothetical protein [bacterium]